jgi:hypothetical protein
MATLKRIDIKSIGLWNPRIFNPSWLKAVLSPVIPEFQDKDILGSLNVTELSVSYKIKSFELKPTFDSLIFEIHNFDDDGINLACTAFSTMFFRLGETPVKATGINFVFDINESDISSVKNLFSSLESSQYNKRGYVPTQLAISSGGNGYSTNIVREIIGGNNIYIVNFHYEPKLFMKALKEGATKLIRDHLLEAKGIIDEA